MYAQWRDWAGEELDAPPKFYHGTTQFTADTLEALWGELQAAQAALAAALGLREPPSRLAHVRSMMVSKYEAVVADPSNLLTALHSNAAWKHSLHPHKKLDNGKVRAPPAPALLPPAAPRMPGRPASPRAPRRAPAAPLCGTSSYSHAPLVASATICRRWCRTCRAATCQRTSPLAS